MRFIPTRIHGILDYVVGLLLIASPWMLNFDRGGAEMWVPIILGVGALVYSSFTDYELGVVKRLTVSMHLRFDAVSGILLAVSPWLFGFSEFVYLPHLILGIFEVAASLTTKRAPAPRATTHA